MSEPAVTIDVRVIEPRFRHSLIFGVFDHLPAGQALHLTNDHDPKPLYYQFQAEFPGIFSWDYLEQGPERFKVRIGKQGVTPPREQKAHGGGCC